MKKINATAGWLLGLMLAGSVCAEVPLESKEALEGTWKLLQTRAGGDAKKAMTREDTWVFKNGKVTILHIPREGTFYDQPPVDYLVEDGKLKVTILGRTDKFETFAVDSIETNKMTLIGKFNNYYDFAKK